MATYQTKFYENSIKPKDPVAKTNRVFITHTLTAALANGTSDTLRVMKLPKGVRPIPIGCRVGSFNDPDSGNNATVSLKYTDGTTTNTLIATGNLQAADTPLAGTDATLYANSFHYTENDSYYVYLTAEANDVDINSQLAFVIEYESV